MKDDFKNYILDQLEGLGEIRDKYMFGGWGLYLEDKFFAIVSDDRIYFKTNPETAKKYIKYEMVFFKPSEVQHLKNYYEVPPDVIEDRELLSGWAEGVS